MNKILLSISTILFAASCAQQKDYPIQPVAFTQVHVNDNFWQPKMQVNASVTIPYIMKMCEDNGRIDNFLAAAGKIENTNLFSIPF